MFECLLHPGLSLTCVYRDRIGYLFSLRELDRKVMRCVLKQKNPEPSEDSRRSFANYFVKKNRITKCTTLAHEIKHFKAKGIVGFRASSSTLLTFQQTIRLFGKLGRNDLAHALQKCIKEGPTPQPLPSRSRVNRVKMAEVKMTEVAKMSEMSNLPKKRKWISDVRKVSEVAEVKKDVRPMLDAAIVDVEESSRYTTKSLALFGKCKNNLKT
jgi:hypothetical protein